jgi:hypothetical protein
MVSTQQCYKRQIHSSPSSPKQQGGIPFLSSGEKCCIHAYIKIIKAFSLSYNLNWILFAGTLLQLELSPMSVVYVCQMQS